MRKTPFYDRWATLTDEELERILDAAFKAVVEKRIKDHG